MVNRFERQIFEAPCGSDYVPLFKSLTRRVVYDGISLYCLLKCTEGIAHLLMTVRLFLINLLLGQASTFNIWAILYPTLFFSTLSGFSNVTSSREISILTQQRPAT